MARFKVRIQGIQEATKKLKSLESDINQAVSNELEVNSADMASDAQAKAPVNDGNLRNGIGFEGKDMNFTVFSNAQYSPFVEFGTKTRVNVGPELREIAAQFRGMKIDSGKFEDNIRQWMKGKGIPEEALFPIMASILRYGIFPQPFFGPAYGNMVRKLPKDLNTAIKREIDKLK